MAQILQERTSIPDQGILVITLKTLQRVNPELLGNMCGGALNDPSPPPAPHSQRRVDGDDLDDAQLVEEVANGNKDALLLLHPLIMESVLNNNQEILRTVDQKLVHVLQNCDPQILKDAIHLLTKPKPQQQQESDDFTNQIQAIARGDKEALLLLNPIILKAVLKDDREILYTVDQTLVDALHKYDHGVLHDAINEIDRRVMRREEAAQASYRVTRDTFSGLMDGQQDALFDLDPILLEAFIHREDAVVAEMDPVLVRCLENFPIVAISDVLRNMEGRRAQKRPFDGDQDYRAAPGHGHRHGPGPESGSGYRGGRGRGRGRGRGHPGAPFPKRRR